jgi:hypothetical protein
MSKCCYKNEEMLNFKITDLTQAFKCWGTLFNSQKGSGYKMSLLQ